MTLLLFEGLVLHGERVSEERINLYVCKFVCAN